MLLQVPLVVLTLAQGGLQPLWAYRLFSQRSLLSGLLYGCVCTAMAWRLSSILLKVRPHGALTRSGSRSRPSACTLVSLAFMLPDWCILLRVISHEPGLTSSPAHA